MPHRSLASSKRWLLGLTLTFAVSLVGCDKGPEFGHVTGVIKMDGQPMDMVRVLFVPDPLQGNAGSHSECVTGEDGTFELTYSRDAEIKGAIVGWHCVALEDIAAEESRDQFRPIRLPDKYLTAAQSPLRFEVKSGDQNFEIEVEKKK